MDKKPLSKNLQFVIEGIDSGLRPDDNIRERNSCVYYSKRR